MTLMPAAVWQPVHYPQPLIWLGCFVCFILVVLAMFRNGAGTTGVITLLAACCCGLGTVVALVVGWANAERWGIRNLMIVYTIFVVLFLITGLAAPAPVMVDVRERFVPERFAP